MNEFTHTLLCVDDEVNILNALKRLLRREGYRFLSATSGREGFDVLKENEVQIVISDQRMPEMNGTEFMARVKDAYPDILRIILTGYTDVGSITDSINQGHIYKFFLKPWNDQNLKLEIRQAFEQYDLIQDNKRLDKTVIEQNSQLRRINENLEELVAERTQEIALQNQALALSHAILEELPLSILGVDAHGVVVLANRMARSLMGEQEIDVGVPLGSHFPGQVSDAVQKVIEDGQCRFMEMELAGHKPARLNLSPLSGYYSGKGVIITLKGLDACRNP
jgi:response regulator RpfG family c-di-GMP phosphodiesterase